MSHAPLVLSDDDFAEDAPPGYLSQKLKDQYIVWMILVLVFCFLAQMIFPVIISFASMPFVMMNSTMGDLPQYTRMTAWRGALWYPVLDTPGSGRAGCKLHALDDKGEPTETPAIELDSQPEWLLADGDRLWAVSKNEVTEVLSDGGRPVVMFPTRYLENPSPPFLHEGKLAVVDQGHEETDFKLLTFDNGEWQPAAALRIRLPGQSLPAIDSSEGDVPADAQAPANQTVDVNANNKATSPMGYGLPSTTSVQIISLQDVYHVLASRDGMYFHHVGLPLSADADTRWTALDFSGEAIKPSPFAPPMQSDVVSLTTVDNVPTIYYVSSRRNATELRQWINGNWQITATRPHSGAGVMNVITFRTPETGSTFAVVDKLSGLSQELQELHSDRIEKVKSLSGVMEFANPMSAGRIRMQIASNLSVYGPLIVQVLLMTWLMRTHRDPNYYKGRIAVEHASLLMRVIAMFIDVVLVYVPIGVIWYRWYVSLESDYFDLMQTFFQDPLPVLNLLLPPMAATGGCLLVWGLLCWLMTAWMGCTPGKYVCGVRVVKTNLENPGLLRALIRIIIWGIETGILNAIIAFACIAFTFNRQRVADLVAGTVVVKARSLRHARNQMASATMGSDTPRTV